MVDPKLSVAERVADVAATYQLQVTGHAASAVSVVISEDVLVVTLHGALSDAERSLAQSPEGARRVQEFHREMFAHSSQQLRDQIKEIIGRPVSEAIAEVEPKSGSVIHAFSSGTLVQVFLLGSPKVGLIIASTNI